MLITLFIFGNFINNACGEIVSKLAQPNELMNEEVPEEIGVLTPTPREYGSEQSVKQQKYTLQQNGTTWMVIPMISLYASNNTPAIDRNEISSSKRAMERNRNRAMAYSNGSNTISGVMGADGVVIFPCNGSGVEKADRKFLITLNGRSTPARCR